MLQTAALASTRSEANEIPPLQPSSVSHRTIASNNYKVAFQYFGRVAGGALGTNARVALLPLTNRQQYHATDQQHPSDKQAEDQQHADHGKADQQRQGARQRIARMAFGGQREMHVLKIRVVKSTTYESNDGANSPAGQVPMDTETSANSGAAKALCRLDEIPDGGVAAVDAQLPAGEESLVLFRQGEAVQAFLNICPHAGRRLDYAPGKFLINKGNLICAVHGASFNTVDGLCVAGPCRGEYLRPVMVSVEDEMVYLTT